MKRTNVSIRIRSLLMFIRIKIVFSGNTLAVSSWVLFKFDKASKILSRANVHKASNSLNYKHIFRMIINKKFSIILSYL